jgi:hypothetical protein
LVGKTFAWLIISCIINTCKQFIAEYKAHWFKESKKSKNPNARWYERFRYVEEIMSQSDAQLSSSIVREIIEKTSPNTITRAFTLQALALVLEYFDISKYDKLIQSYKAKNNPTYKKRNVPSDSIIKAVFQDGFKPKFNTPKKFYHRYSQWQFL